MGRAKRWWDEVGGSYEAVVDKYVCASCFDDGALRAFVESFDTTGTCSYCDNELPIAPLSDVVAHIQDCLNRRYDDAANGLGFEGEYLGNTWDTYDLVRENIELADDDHEQLLDDIIEGLPQIVWSETDPYGPRAEDILQWSWDRFVEIIKHERRFFFQNLSHGKADRDLLSPGDLLKTFAENCEQSGLFKILPANTILWRTRPRINVNKFTDPCEMGPPPAMRAKQNRMSPAGIPMLYAAGDQSTAEAETLHGNTYWATAQFRTLTDIIILDLSEFEPISFFDADNANLYAWSLFLMGFLHDASKPIVQDGSEHIEYVPTQVITEYFRSVANWEGLPVLGIRYRSSKNYNGSCYALFLTKEDVKPGHTDRADGRSYFLEMTWVENYMQG